MHLVDGIIETALYNAHVNFRRMENLVRCKDVQRRNTGDLGRKGERRMGALFLCVIIERETAAGAPGNLREPQRTRYVVADKDERMTEAVTVKACIDGGEVRREGMPGEIALAASFGFIEITNGVERIDIVGVGKRGAVQGFQPAGEQTDTADIERCIGKVYKGDPAREHLCAVQQRVNVDLDRQKFALQNEHGVQAVFFFGCDEVFK